MSQQHLPSKSGGVIPAEPDMPVHVDKGFPLQAVQPEEDSLQPPGISRRNFLKRGGLLAALTLLDSPFASQLWASTSGEQVIPFKDQPSTAQEGSNSMGNQQNKWEN